VHSPLGRTARNTLCALLCAAAVLAAGCHNNNFDSGYGIAWVTLTDEPGDFTSYIVNVDSVTLTGVANGAITAVSTPESVDFTKLSDISELWAAASVPDDTYTSATITLDYTNAVISVMVNGVPQKATVIDSTGGVLTTVSVTVNLDKSHPMVITPTYASSSASRLAIDFNLAVSNSVNLATTPATVTVKPYFTVATSAPDHKLIRVRGPMINSSVGVGTYTVYGRPFYDEVNSLGSITLFNQPTSIYTINGTTAVGAAGITAVSQLSAGTTMTAAYTTFTPSVNNLPSPPATAGTFYVVYAVVGSSLEDIYTQGIEGDVIARSGNTLTVRGATLFNTIAQLVSYIDTPDSVVVLGPNTIVTADDNTSLKGLNYRSISVGQHIIARGIYSLPASGVTTLDATGDSSTNTGSVRIQSTQLWGSTVAAAAGSVALNLQTINNWPVSVFNFAGSGVSTAQNSLPADYLIDTGALAVPAGTVAGDPLWIGGFASPFGTAPPDFIASTVDAEATVPASLRVNWTAAGAAAPFATLTGTGMTIDLSNANYSSGEIRIGAESVDLKSLAATPQIVPAATPPSGAAGVPAVFLPLFAVGNPVTSAATVDPTTTTTASTAISMFNTFATYATQLGSSITTTSPALRFEATGLYNRASNTFTATRINVVL